MVSGVQRNGIGLLRALLQRCAGLVLILCVVLGLLNAPMCLKAQPMHGAAKLVIAVPSEHVKHTESACADPCCQHRQPADTPKQNRDCVDHCAAVDTSSFPGSVEPPLLVGYVAPLHSVTAVLSTVRIKQIFMTVQGPEPPLSFARPLRI